MTEKLNSILEQSSTLTRFILSLITLVGIIFGIFLYPAMSRINGLEKEIAEVRSELKSKVSQQMFELSMKNVNEKLVDISGDIRAVRDYLMKGAGVG